MNSLYHPKWQWLIIALTLWSGFFVYLLLSTESLSFGRIFIFLCIIPFSLFSLIKDISEVTLTEEHIEISSPFPFTKTRIISYEDIRSYDEIKDLFTLSDKPVGGKITPKSGTQIFLSSRGTKNFSDLHEVLSNKFPTLSQTL